MYTAVSFDFGQLNPYKEELVKNFEETKHKTLKEIELFNYHLTKGDIGKVLYITHYGEDRRFGSYLMVVREGDEEMAKEKLKEAALQTIQERIRKDTAIAEFIQA